MARTQFVYSDECTFCLYVCVQLSAVACCAVTVVFVADNFVAVWKFVYRASTNISILTLNENGKGMDLLISFFLAKGEVRYFRKFECWLCVCVSLCQVSLG